MKRIVLMGSAEFSIPIFQAIYQHNEFKVVALYCQPDKRKGRGQKLSSPPCKIFAEANNIPVIQVKSLKSDLVFEQYLNLKADLTLVAAYGKILPKRFLDAPKFNSVNVHSSLLPELRGAAPINWAIVRGYKKTGVTFMKMAEELDSGDIIEQVGTNIEPTETAEELEKRLSLLAKDQIVSVLKKYMNGQIKPKAQDHEKATFAPIMKKEDGKIDFSKSSHEIYNLIRGFYPWPGTYANLNSKRLKIINAEIIHGEKPEEQLKNGEIFNCSKGYVKLKDGAIKLNQVQLEGKKAVSWKDFICGCQNKTDLVLT